MIAIPLMLLSGGAIALSSSLPNLYQAETTILLIPQRVPETYVRTTVTSRLEDRLRTMREQILSRTRLEGLINDFKLYPQESKKLLMEQLVLYMRDQVNIALVRESSFRISFNYGDPVVAARVTERLASLYAEENLRDRELQADSTSRFLEAQLNDAKRRLVEQEKRLETYRREHSGSLPTQVSSNLQMIQTTQAQLVSLGERTNRMRDRRMDVARQMTEQQETIAAGPPPPPVAVIPANANPAAVPAGSPAQQLATQRGTLAGLLLTKTPEHPEVTRLQRQIRDLEARVREEAAAAAPAPSRPTTTPPASAAMLAAQNRLRDLNIEAANLDKQIDFNEQEDKRLKDALAIYQARLEQLPTRESELTELTRDYGTLQASYQTMLTKREDSVVAANLERRQIGEQFRVVDPARVPQVPISPNRLMINAIGAALGLLLGLGTAVLRELFDSTMRTDLEVGGSLGLPTLAMIPVVSTQSDRRRITRRRRLEMLAVIAAVLAAGAAAYWKLIAGH